MAYKDFDAFTHNAATKNSPILIQTDGQDIIDVPDSSYIKDAALIRDGGDLVLDGPDGMIVIEGYFHQAEPPLIQAPDGVHLTPKLVGSFAKSPARFAAGDTMTDESPVGAVQEISGKATVTRADGSIETLGVGTPIYQGDVIETSADGAVNIMFIDETSFAVSEDARLAIDEYVFDPATQSGTSNFSVLKGVFVFTSGLIGRDDPDDVEIETPVGSIGIRGTIIAGDVDTGEITVVEGAIVLKDFQGNEMTLATQFETARFSLKGGKIENLGQIEASEVSSRFASITAVAPTLFSSIQDAAHEQGQSPNQPDTGSDSNNDTGSGSDANPPPPAPNAGPGNGSGLGDGNNGGLGGNNGGFGDTGAGTNPPPAGTGTNPPPPPPSGGGTGGPNAGPSGGNNPPPPPANTTPPPPPSGGTTAPGDSNAAPTSLRDMGQSHAPDAFFTMGAGLGQTMSWSYVFGHEFFDPDGLHEALRFQLHPDTVALLNTLTGTLQSGTGVGIAGVTGDENYGWSFNPVTGQLEFTFNPSLMADIDFDIMIQAIDANGAVSGYEIFNFETLLADQVLTDTNTDGTFDQTGVNGQTLIADNDVTGLFENNSGNTVFLSEGYNTIEVTLSDNNTFYLGNGTNSVWVAEDSIGNTIFGGHGIDTIQTNTGDIDIYTLNGDDRIELSLGPNSSVANDLAMGSGNVIDMGHNPLSRAQAIAHGTSYADAAGGTYGFGDTLAFSGGDISDTTNDLIDFSNILDQNTLTGIERIDTTATTEAVTFILSYNDIIQMTDSHNTLVINLGSNDILQLQDMTGFQQIGDDVALDLAQGGGTESYDIYTYEGANGTVTLFINDTNASAGNVTIDGIAAS